MTFWEREKYEDSNLLGDDELQREPSEWEGILYIDYGGHYTTYISIPTQNMGEGCGDDSVAKNTDWPCSESEFGPQHPCQAAHNCQ